MTEEPKEKTTEETSFIKEKIVPRRKNRILRRLRSMLFVICMAAVFGLVAKTVYVLSGGFLERLFGVEQEQRKQVELPRPTGTPTPRPTNTPTPTSTPCPTNTPSPTPTKVPEIVTPVPTIIPEVTPEPTRLPQELLTPAPTELPQEELTPTPDPEQENSPAPGDAVVDYWQIYATIREVANEVSKALVTVEAVEQSVDWFQEIYERRTSTTGLILGNDGVDLLILVSTEHISGANSIEVHFGEEIIAGRIYALDVEYGMAVVAVPLERIKNELLANLQLGLLAAEEDIIMGTPVIALGAPNGYHNSMEVGMITSLGSKLPVTVGTVSYFTTNISEYPGAYGFVVNLKGEVLGMITHTLKINPEDGIFTAISLDAVRGVIVKLLNNADRALFGIKGEDLPANLRKEYGVTGVYVTEVKNASPALMAGIKAGDIIVAMGSEDVDGMSDFTDIILARSIKETIQVKLLRTAEEGMREMTVEVVLTDKK